MTIKISKSKLQKIMQKLYYMNENTYAEEYAIGEEYGVN